MKKFSHAGEKIRQLRQAMDLSQEDISNHQLSKDLINMIEENKRNLTWNTAHTIAESLNKYYKVLGQEITAEFLMETEEEQVKKIIRSDIDALQSSIAFGDVNEDLIHNTLDKLINLVNEYGLTRELIALKTLRGNYYYDNYQYKEALGEYLDALDCSFQNQDYEQVAKMYILIGSTYQMSMMIDTAILHYVKAYDTVIANKTPNKDEIKAQSLLNQILCYDRVKRYDLVISHIELFKRLKWEDKKEVSLYKSYLDSVLLIEANTYRDIGNYEVAGTLYEGLLEEQEQLDQETTFLLYENTAILYREQGRVKKALEYLQQAYTLKDHVNLNYIPALYLYQATCYNLLEEHDKVVVLLENAMALAKEVSKPHLMIDLHFAFVEVYMELKDRTKALQHLQEVEVIILDKDFRPKMHDLYSYYIELYNEIGERDKIVEFANKLREQCYLKIR